MLPFGKLVQLIAFILDAFELDCLWILRVVSILNNEFSFSKGAADLLCGEYLFDLRFDLHFLNFNPKQKNYEPRSKYSAFNMYEGLNISLKKLSKITDDQFLIEYKKHNLGNYFDLPEARATLETTIIDHNASIKRI